MRIDAPLITGSLSYNGTSLQDLSTYATTSSVNNLIQKTGSYALTGSNYFSGSQVISGSITATGNITAQTLIIQTVTSSVLFSTGSNKLGSSLSNTQELTGSVGITGSFAVNTTGLFVSSSGLVGIGTSSPGLNLAVQGLYGLPATSGAQGTGIFRAQDSSSNIALDMGVIQYFGSWIQSINKANSSALTLALNPNGGNVGIGTSTPTPRDTGALVLELYGTSSGRSSLKFTNSTSGTGATDGMWLGYDDTLNFNIINNEAGYITLGTSNTERMRIFANGNIGIGTTSDNGGKLQVTGAATFSTSIQSPGMYGRVFTPTSTSGATAYIDTGIALENTAMYMLTVYANPAAAGGLYSYNEVGLVNLNSQYNGSTNTNIIKFTRLSISNTSVYPGNLTLSVVFLIGGSEVTQTSSYLPSGQIRIKIDGYSNSTGTSTAAYLTKIG